MQEILILCKPIRHIFTKNNMKVLNNCLDEILKFQSWNVMTDFQPFYGMDYYDMETIYNHLYLH